MTPDRVAIEAVDKARTILAVARERGKQRVEMALGLRAALHGEARRFVQDDDVVVAVKHEAFDERAVLGADLSALAFSAWVSGDAAGSGGTRTVSPPAMRWLAFTRAPSTRTWPVRSSFSKRPCVSLRIVAREPAIEAQAVVVRLHLALNDGGHGAAP